MFFLIIPVILVVLLLCWIRLPYSPLKEKFVSDMNERMRLSGNKKAGDVFFENDFRELPDAVRDYIDVCGYPGTPRRKYLRMEYHGVDFYQNKKGPCLTIDYSQLNLVKDMERLAFIDTRLFGIPFQGYDTFLEGKGAMKGVLLKFLPLFKETGKEMDQAALVTWLSECLFLPRAALSRRVRFEEIDACHVKAEAFCEELHVSGIFTFNEAHEMISFETTDRAQIGKDGTVRYIPWKALCSEYQVYTDGIKRPSVFSAVWEEPEGDFIYFNGRISMVDGAYPKTEESELK